MPPAEILHQLRLLTGQKEAELLPLATEAAPLPTYAPAAKYLRDLLAGSKPEAAAEELFTALCREVLKLDPARQVGIREGWVDFLLRDPSGRVVVSRTGLSGKRRKQGRPNQRSSCCHE